MRSRYLTVPAGGSYERQRYRRKKDAFECGRGLTRRSPYRWARSHIASAARSAIANRYLYAADLLLSAVALVLAVWLRFGPQMLESRFGGTRPLVTLTAVFVLICAVTFPAAGLYKRKWKYASIPDYIVLVEAALIASLILMTFIFVRSHFAIIPHSIIAIEIMTLVSLLAGLRLTFRQEDLKGLVAASHWTTADLNPRIPVLLIGAGHEADLYLRALQRDPTSEHQPVGFLNNSSDNSRDETGSMLRGVPVLGSTDEFNDVVAELDAQGLRPRHLIFTAPLSSLDDGEAERLIACADRMGMAVSRLNPATELRNPRVASRVRVAADRTY